MTFFCHELNKYLSNKYFILVANKEKKGRLNMTKLAKKICLGACAALAIPFLTIKGTQAADAPADSSPTAAAATESASVESPAADMKAAFPDENFRKFINDEFFSGKLKDGDAITESVKETLGAYTGSLKIVGLEIEDLKGIEFFSAITELDASHNNIKALDLSGLKQLKKLNVAYNNLTEIKFGQAYELEALDCSNNTLTALELAGFTKLLELNCSNNEIAVLNTAGLFNLKELNCSSNALSAINVENMTALEVLYCGGNGIVNINTSALKNLKVLENRKSRLTLKVQTVSVGTDSFCGVVLPTGAVKPENISNKGVYKDTVNAIVWDKLTSVPSSFTYTYLIPGTKQTVTVTVNTDKTEFAEKSVTLGAVATVQTSSTAYNKIKITWSGVDGATGYRIYRSTSKTSGFKKIKTITSSSKVSYTNSGISCGTTYYYKVRAYRLIDGIYYYGGYSGVVSGKPVPAAPKSLSIAKASKKKVTVSWSKVTGASGYRIYRSTSSSGGFSKIKTVTSGSKVTYTKTTSRNVKYYYKVRAYTTVNGKKIWGAYSSVKGKTLS